MGSVRDPIHGFIEYSDKEEAVINSEAFQRLRFIRQLATTSWLYPATMHSRFEHSLGVMQVATRIFDKLWPTLVHIEPDWTDDQSEMRKRLRLAALLHDVGHAAFSHAFEGLLGDKTHEWFTGQFVLKDEELLQVFAQGFAISPDEIAAIALDPSEKDQFPELLEVESSQIQFLNEIITSDLFGADRMDYLLRDSYHAGVAYGQFDLDRVLDTITVVKDEAGNLNLGIEEGGVEAVEGLLVARYYMSKQVYFHHVRRILDVWIKEAIQKVYSENNLDSLDEYRKLTDDVVQVAVRDKWLEGKCPEGEVFFKRTHPKLAYQVPNNILAQFPLKIHKIKRALKSSVGNKFSDDQYRIESFDKESVSAYIRDVPVVRKLGEDSRYGFESRLVGPGTSDGSSNGGFAGVLPRIQGVRLYAVDENDRLGLANHCDGWQERTTFAKGG